MGTDDYNRLKALTKEYTSWVKCAAVSAKGTAENWDTESRTGGLAAKDCKKPSMDCAQIFQLTSPKFKECQDDGRDEMEIDAHIVLVFSAWQMMRAVFCHTTFLSVRRDET